MTSWFNLIVSNRIIHGNKLPKWGYSVPKSFNNDGNHGHDVSQYYFIIGFNFCICQLGLASGWAQLVSRLMHSCQQLTQTHTPAITLSRVRKGKGRLPSHQQPHTLLLNYNKIFQPAVVKRNNMHCLQIMRFVILWQRTATVTPSLFESDEPTLFNLMEHKGSTSACEQKSKKPCTK